MPILRWLILLQTGLASRPGLEDKAEGTHTCLFVVAVAAPDVGGSADVGRKMSLIVENGGFSAAGPTSDRRRCKAFEANHSIPFGQGSSSSFLLSPQISRHDDKNVSGDILLKIVQCVVYV